MRDWLLSFLTRYRAYVLVFVGLPVGALFDLVLRLRGFFVQRLLTAPQLHETRVRRVQEDVRRWAAQPREARRPLCTDRKTWMNLSTRFEPKHQWHRVRMGDLRDILALDEERRTVRVEPFVTVGQITDHLVPRGFMLAVTLEIREATVGGLSMAVGMTTHSHKVGLLQETVVAYEVVLADGSLVRVTAESHPDLFYALPWSHGTLGLLVALELRVIPVKPYIRLTYQAVHGQAAYCERLRALAIAEDAPDFVEATVYSREDAVIMTGNFDYGDGQDGAADSTPTGNRAAEATPINRLGLPWKPWFYKHVEGYLWRDDAVQELVPLKDYLMRHNRSIFWVVADMIPFGNHPLFRLLLGWLMPPRIAFLKFSTTPAVRKMTFTKQVFQDIVLPMSAMSRAIDASHRLFEMYPVLLYPSRIYDHGALQGQLRAPREQDRIPGTDHGMFFDLGVYGVPLPILQGKPFKTVHAMRKMEDFTREVGGYPFLYADTFMTREEFGQMFNLDLYEKVRVQYGADVAFPHLYDKIKPEVDMMAVLREEEESDPGHGA